MTLEFSELAARAAEVIAAVAAGETVVLTRDGIAAAHLTPIGPTAEGNERLIGFARGTVTWVSDDFAAPLPDDTWAEGTP